MSFSAYLEYKPSGFDWLSEVPAHWMDRKIARDIPFVVGWTPPSGKDEYYDGDLPWVTIADLTQMSVEDTKSKISHLAVQDKGAKIVPAGSMLFSFKLSVGKVAFLTIDSYTNEAIAGFLPCGPLDLEYWKYAAPEFIPRYGRENIYGATLLNQELIGSVRFYSPARAEQSQIARFLDHETARIDSLIEEQQRLIELLKEKRQAVISHAVTKGLDPTVPMKDSGVEWLGEVPAHWERKRLKNISPFITVGIVVNPSDYVAEEGLPFIYGGEVKEGLIEVDKARKISLKDSLKNRKTMLEAGDIVTMRVGYPGLTAVVPPECEGGNCASVMLVKRGGFDSRWLCAVMNSRLVRQQVEVVQYGAAQKQFNIADAIEFWMFRPPLSEQAIIAEFVEEQSSIFDELAAESENSMAILQERRSALISAAVTGKIDVRGWQPPIVESTQHRKSVEA